MPDELLRRGWMRLDNAAKIYPAAMRRSWTALFRFSANLTEAVDPVVLQQAVNAVTRRFPAFAVRLKRGVFWFYLQHTDRAPTIQQDVQNPCVPMDLKDNDRFLFRVRYYESRIACEYFHVLTDGTGGLLFLKTLVAEYLRLKYGAAIPRGSGLLDCDEPPRPEELEDAFLRYARPETLPRAEKAAYHVRGTDEPPDVIHVITGMCPVAELKEKARSYGVSVTEYLTAVLLLCLDEMQRRSVRPKSRLKPVKVCVPVNLRSFFPSETVRNFALYVNPGMEPRLGHYTIEELTNIVHCQMALEATEKNLCARFSQNVRSEQSIALRLVPLFLKNLVMRLVFHQVGDRITSTCLSNLGLVRLPQEMAQYVTRMDMMLGPLSQNRVVLAALSYQGSAHLTFTSTIRETDLPRAFFRYLVRAGIHVKVESNNPAEGKE